MAETPKEKIIQTAEHINAVSDYFDLGVKCTPDDLWIETGFCGQGYNIPDPITREYIYMLARTEGILLDPCYTGKAFRGFVELVRKHKIPKSSVAIFVHTGGTPGLFTKEHVDAMQKELWND